VLFTLFDLAGAPTRYGSVNAEDLEEALRQAPSDTVLLIGVEKANPHTRLRPRRLDLEWEPPVPTLDPVAVFRLPARPTAGGA
jgi:hypothetical protein